MKVSLLYEIFKVMHLFSVKSCKTTRYSSLFESRKQQLLRNKRWPQSKDIFIKYKTNEGSEGRKQRRVKWNAITNPDIVNTALFHGVKEFLDISAASIVSRHGDFEIFLHGEIRELSHSCYQAYKFLNIVSRFLDHSGARSGSLISGWSFLDTNLFFNCSNRQSILQNSQSARKLLSIDFEEAFGSLEWNFMFKYLEIFGFGHSLQH